MVALNDGSTHVIGAQSAKALEEHFGIVTVDDLLRHYPRKYSHGMSVSVRTGSRPRRASTSPSSTRSRSAESRFDQPAAQARVPGGHAAATEAPR